MARYFLEVAYKGTNYSGFQTQVNAVTIQGEVEKAFAILQRERIIMTGSSRTDAGVHARQNYFHFDFTSSLHPQFLYKINAILPGDIVAKSIREVSEEAHCRFDANSRTYEYFLYRSKDSFLEDRAWYFPYTLDMDALDKAAALLMTYHDFTSFSKRNTQVKTFQCKLVESVWRIEGDCIIYRVRGNRFLRGMVRALVSTMLLVGRGKLTLDDFKHIIETKDSTKSSFAAPAKGLFLEEVIF